MGTHVRSKSAKFSHVEGVISIKNVVYLTQQIDLWRRLFMKKETKKSILFYAASALLYMASLISFISGNDNSMAVVWLCLGSSFLCLGSTHLCLGLSRKKKGNDKTDASNK